MTHPYGTMKPQSEDRMPVILHIAPTPFFSNRGCHIRIQNATRAMDSFAMHPVVCTYHHGHDPGGIDIRRIPPIPGYRQTKAGYSPFKFPADILLFFRVWKTALTERPAVFHGHLHEGALIGWAVNLLLPRPIPLVMDMQGSLSGELEAYGAFRSFPAVIRLFRLLEKWIYRIPNAIVCSSENSRAMIQSDFGITDRDVEFLGDVVPPEFFHTRERSESSRRLGIPKSLPVVIYTGSLLPAKGVPVLLEAMFRILKRRKDVFFVLAGYPADEVRQMIRNRGLEDFCLIPGEVPYRELPEWLEAADIAVDPKPEGSGEASGKIIHYMAAGLPVVCFDLPENRRMAGEAGYFADPGDPDSLADTIEKALEDGSGRREKGRTARASAEERFSRTRLGKKLAALYERLSNAGR